MQAENYIKFKHLMNELRKKAQGEERAIRRLVQIENAIEKYQDEFANTETDRTLAEEISDIWTCYYFEDHYGDEFGRHFQGVINAAKEML